jgi:hypothetical protein
MSEEKFELMRLPPHIEATVTRAVPIKKSGLYAAWPGTGPDGETCGSCKHCVRAWNGRYRKCGLLRSIWTGGPGTDIKARSAACSKWEAV